MSLTFPASYTDILARIDRIDPVKYGQSRNYVDGDVTYLSPYLSRGVISSRFVLEKMIEKGYRLSEMESFVKELCWRDYFQRTAQVKNPDYAIKQEQSDVTHYQLPKAIAEATTEIDGIDQHIKRLYETGYMHNHCRMYTAFLTCNLAKSHWLLPARWMYYHLLDGDWASNACSWQWVAGANSAKKYYANQENINKYTATQQSGSYLDISYEMLEKAAVPEILKATITPEFCIELPSTNIESWNPELPTFIYNYYQMDPLWHCGEPGNRLLLLDPALFEKYPVSQRCIDFLLALGKNIPNLNIFKGSFAEFIERYPSKAIFFKEHPMNTGYQGTEEPRDWICESVTGYYPSFFAYWKKIEKYFREQGFY